MNAWMGYRESFASPSKRSGMVRPTTRKRSPDFCAPLARYHAVRQLREAADSTAERCSTCPFEGSKGGRKLRLLVNDRDVMRGELRWRRFVALASKS